MKNKGRRKKEVFEELARSGSAAIFRLWRTVVVPSKWKLSKMGVSELPDKLPKGAKFEKVMDTLAVIKREDGSYIISAAVKSPRDEHSRQIGYNIATGRVIHTLQGKEVVTGKNWTKEIRGLDHELIDQFFKGIAFHHPYYTVETLGTKDDTYAQTIDRIVDTCMGLNPAIEK